jgi:site-specific DNA-methyltransferase (adenine-specific)
MSYEELKNTVIQGDCLKVMKTILDKSIDLVVTSPPYNCGIKYETYNDSIDWKNYYLWCEEWLKELYRILAEDGRMCLNHYLSCGQSNNRHAPLMKLNCLSESIGFKHHGLAIWWDITLSNRTSWGSWLSASAPYINSPFEGILILYKNQWKKNIRGKTEISKEEFMESCSGVWKIAPEHNREHPAPFPKKLASRCIRLFSYENDLILDPFMGSGTTGVACVELGRSFIGIEIEKKYYDIAKRRIENAVAQGRLF